MSVRAAVMTGPGSIEVQRFPLPDPEPGAVLMRVIFSGVCGTDRHTWLGETTQYAGTPHERGVEFPLICGHENVGEIVAIGGDAPLRDGTGVELRVGDRIVPAANVTCGRCWFCRGGFPYYACEALEDYGNSLGCADPPHLFGGWAEHMYLLPGTTIFRVPDDVPSEFAALTELMAVTHGLDTARALPGRRFGDSVVVVGAGPLGLCHLVKARLLGCAELIALDVHASRLAVAHDLGATLAIDVRRQSEEEQLEQVRSRTDGRGADVVVDCSGTSATFPACLKLVRFGGTVIEAGAFVSTGPVRIDPNADICIKDVCVLGVGGDALDGYIPTLELLGRAPELARMITHRLPLERAADALELAASGQAAKVLIDPGATESRSP